MLYDVILDGKTHRVEVQQKDGRWWCRLDGREIAFDAVLPRANVVSILMDGQSYEVKRERVGEETHLWLRNERHLVEVRDPRSLTTRRAVAGGAAGPKKIVAPMPGKVVRVLVGPRTEVEQGQGLLVVEAMKMQNEIKSPKKGTVQQVLTREGAAVNAGEVLAVVE